MKRTIISLIAFVAFAAFVLTSAKADECPMGTPAAAVEAFKAHDSIIAVKSLTAQETTFGLVSVVTDGPGAADIAEGVLALRSDGVLILAVWMKNGECGHAMIPPHLVDKVMRAIHGTNA